MFYAVYIFLLVAVHALFWRSKRKTDIFLNQQKIHWLISGLSLFAVTSSIETGQVITGILQTQGLSGMWIMWSSSISVFIVPFVFAPLWAKLDFPTDNQFIRFRFSGKGAKMLHVFRSVYVGVVVTSILISFHILAFSRVLEVFFSVDRSIAILLSGTAVLLFALKNRLTSKMHTDVLHSILYFVALVIVFWFTFDNQQDWQPMLESIRLDHPETVALFPTQNDTDGWMLLIAYLGIQWWSAQLFDGGGPEMKRFAAAKSKWDTIKTALIPVLINTVLFFVFLGMGMMVFAQTHYSGEIEFLQFIYLKVASWLHPLCVIGFFALFISASEGLLHWGGAFVTIDVFETYFQWPKSSKAKSVFGVLVMLLLVVCAILIAVNSRSLFSLIQLMLSISAGVAPVFILRWIWLRINAWSQLSAMLTSGITTVIVRSIYGSDQFPIQLMWVTALTTCAWLLVTFLTPPDDDSVLQQFRERIPSPKILLNSIGIALLAGIGLLIATVSVVYLLFS
jgi:Na+/proline symporter